MPLPTLWSSAIYVPLSGSQTIDALLGGTRWSSSSLTYSFPGVGATWSTDITTGYGPRSSGTEPWNISFAPISASNQVYFALALQQWANVANLQFSQVADTPINVGDIRVAFSYISSYANAQAWSTTPGNSSTAGDVWFNSIGSSAINSWASGSYSFFTALHELGHALGFKHPFYDTGSLSVVLPSSLDTTQYTVMSYTSPANDLFRTITYSADGSLSLQTNHVNPETPMVLDIAAMQYLYGANMAYNTGDDVYSFDIATPFYKTIWDAGGNDTISVSNFSESCTVDLTPGNYSSIKISSAPIPAGYTTNGGTGSMPTYDGTYNLGIAYGAIIENSIGGSGDDMLIGNEANNTLMGGTGNDNMNGGIGIDIASYIGNRVNFTIAQSDTSFTVTDSTGAEGTDTLTNVERIVFTDTNIALDIIGGNGGIAAKILGSVLGGASILNPTYVRVLLDYLDGGTSYADLMGALFNALGITTSTAVATTLLANILDATPPADLVATCVSMIDSGAYSFGTFGVLAADYNADNTDHINLVGLAQTGIEFA